MIFFYYLSSSDPLINTHGFWNCIYWLPWREMESMSLKPSLSLALSNILIYSLRSRVTSANKVSSSVSNWILGITQSKNFSKKDSALKFFIKI